MSSMPDIGIHIGQNIRRIRELRGMKQSALALELGMSQQTISWIESSPEVEEDKLEPIAKVLGVSPEAIKRFNGEHVISTINNENHEYNDRSINAGAYYEMGSVEKITELYEQMLKGERERNKELEQRIQELEAESKKSS